MGNKKTGGLANLLLKAAGRKILKGSFTGAQPSEAYKPYDPIEYAQEKGFTTQAPTEPLLVVVDDRESDEEKTVFKKNVAKVNAEPAMEAEDENRSGRRSRKEHGVVGQIGSSSRSPPLFLSIVVILALVGFLFQPTFQYFLKNIFNEFMGFGRTKKTENPVKEKTLPNEQVAERQKAVDSETLVPGTPPEAPKSLAPLPPALVSSSLPDVRPPQTAREINSRNRRIGAVSRNLLRSSLDDPEDLEIDTLSFSKLDPDVDKNGDLTTDLFRHGATKVIRNPGNGDCLFYCVKRALKDVGKQVEVQDLRRVVADFVNPYHLQFLHELYQDARKERHFDILSDYSFMRRVNSLESLREVMMTRAYFGDEIALEAMEKFFGVTFIVIHLNFRNKLVLSERPQTFEFSKGSPFVILLLKESSVHYELLEHEDRVLMRRDQLPDKLQYLINRKRTEISMRKKLEAVEKRKKSKSSRVR